MKSVNVLMSTYNGENYLKQQIDSILNQSRVKVFLTIRDDGSSDGTKLILEEYVNLDNVNVVYGQNIGFKRSFITLFSDLSRSDCDFYAFSDQDDEWLPEKLISAVEMLNDLGEEPTLYISDRYVSNEELSKISGKVYDNYPPYDWHAKPIARFIDSRGAGCVQVWNRKGHDLLNGYKPKSITHDEWVTAVFTFLGTVVYDDRAFIKYRRHINNVSTTDSKIAHNLFEKILAIISDLKNKKYSQDVALRASLLIEGYGDLLTAADKKSLEVYAGYQKSVIKKISILWSGRIKVTSANAPFNYQLMKILMLLTNGL